MLLIIKWVRRIGLEYLYGITQRETNINANTWKLPKLYFPYKYWSFFQKAAAWNEYM